MLIFSRKQAFDAIFQDVVLGPIKGYNDFQLYLDELLEDLYEKNGQVPWW